ncbi:hypothetical protein ACFVYF_13045 [Streptomyces sp. NPDC058274]|uniref:hypothetical protein n=1 Tax=Streptomyces sp. NPDC058274 TaxID=3346416 RepID=UPI0036E0C080
MRDYVAALPTPRDRNKTLTALAQPVTEPDGAAIPHVAAVERCKNCPLPPADMAGIVSAYRLGGRTERDYEPVKHELGRADFWVRSCQAIQREPPVVSDPP